MCVVDVLTSTTPSRRRTRRSPCRYDETHRACRRHSPTAATTTHEARQRAADARAQRAQRRRAASDSPSASAPTSQPDQSGSAARSRASAHRTSSLALHVVSACEHASANARRASSYVEPFDPFSCTALSATPARYARSSPDNDAARCFVSLTCASASCLSISSSSGRRP